jgi:glycosyltransferase involved in cell wall biosynthesis
MGFHVPGQNDLLFSVLQINQRNELMNDVPVVLIVYNRAKHTLEVLKALREHNIKNIYIFSDAPKSQQDAEAVSLTRRLVHSIDWAKPKIIERTENLGLARNIVSAVDYVFERYDRLILLEDDCVPQRYFFDFIHSCLEKYENNQRVFGISGYTVQIPDKMRSEYPYDLYFCPRIGSWGWATWKREWQHYKEDLCELVEIADEKNIDLTQGGTDIPIFIENFLKGQLKDVWTLNWVLSVYVNNGVYIYPTRSHIRNIGMDSTGLHCCKTTVYDTPVSQQKPNSYPDNVFLDQKIMANFRGYYDIDPARRARVVLPKRLERKEPNLTVGYVSANDIKGGAQKVAWVLKQRVKQRGFPTKMFVGKKFSNDPDVEIITDAIQDGGTHYTDQGYMYYDVNSTFDLVSQTEFMRCDVVHYHNLHGNYFNPFALSTLAKSKPSVWTLHDMHSMTGHCAYAFDCDKWQIGCGNCPHPESYPPIDKDVTSEMWRDKKLIYNESDFELIVPSQWLKDIVEKSILKDKNVHLIYNGINEHIYKPHDRRAVRRKFNVPDNAIILGFIADGGLIAKRKGGDFILAAYEYFRPKYKNVCFACIGGKSNKAPAERFLQIPYVVDENLLAELYCVADVFMFPTLADNCPLVVLELMGCGVPVISFNVGGVPELIEQGRTGFIAGYKNTEEFVKMVEHLVLNKAKREQFSKAGLERLQKMFTLDQMIDKHIVLYERLAEQAAKKNYVPPKNKVILSAAGGDKQYEYLVSAIVSTYNSEKHIHGCLHDLENQTIADKLEIIVVNSGSKQNEDAIVKEFQSRYDNIKYIRTKKRETIYKAWNRAIKAASGKYITNANTDDRHANDALEKMVLALEKNPNKVLVYADCIKVKEVNRKRIPVGEYIAGEFSRSLLFEGKCPPAYQPLWRKNVHDVFGYFDEEFIVSGDYEFWFRLTQKFDFLYLNKIVGECLIGSEAVSQTDDDFLNWENEMVIRKCYEYAMQEAMTIGATGISRHPVFSTWPEVNLWKQRAKAKLSGKQMARTDYVKNTWDYRTKPAPKLTVVIVTYNRRTELLENLNTLNDQTDKDFEVIVVDNSGDLAELKNSVDKFNYGLCGVELNLNLGPSLARNIGTQFAKAGYIAFLDDDAVADKHLVRNIVEHFENHRISGLRGKVLPKTQTNLQNIPVNYDLGDQIITTACEVSSLSAFRKDVLVKMGGFDELLFGSEGMELSYRICKAQKEKVKSILYFPDVIVYHDHRPKGPAQTEKILRKQWMGLLAWRKDNDIKAYRELVCSLYPGRKDIFEDNLLELEGKGLRPVVRPEMETKQCVLNSSVPHKLPSKERKEISVCPSGSDRGFITTTFNAGLCNRIYEWTVLRELSDYYKMDILLNWSEIKDGTVELPNTHYFDFSKASKKFLNSFITINTASTKLSHVADLNLNQNKNYILTCGWEFNRSLTNHDKRLNEVKLNTDYVKKIESFLAQYGDARIVGLHVRRGDYKVTEEFKTSGNFRIPDSWYLDVAGKVLARFPDTKFFLATDGTDDEKKVFFDLPVISICSDSQTPHQDVLELFTLTKLPLIIASVSTFSIFAQEYGRQKIQIWPINPNQQIDEQLQQYQSCFPEMPEHTPKPTISVAQHSHTIYLEKFKTENTGMSLRFLSELSKLCGADVFIETGTYFGNTADMAARIFREVHTIELSSELYKKALQRLAKRKNIYSYLGDSGDVLPVILPKIKGRFLFWLDGHCSGEGTAIGETITPILKELQAIKLSNKSDSIIIMDDIRFFLGQWDYPTAKELRDTILDINRDYEFAIIGDMALAYPRECCLTVSALIRACTISRIFEEGDSVSETIEAEKVIATAQGQEREVIQNLHKDYISSENAGLGAHYRLWYGLTLLDERLYSESFRQFDEAIRLGCNHWRVFWYLAESAYKAGDFTLAGKAAQAVKKTVPNRDVQQIYGEVSLNAMLSKTPRVSTQVLENFDSSKAIEVHGDVPSAYKSSLIAASGNAYLKQSQMQHETSKYIVSAIVSTYNSEKFLRGCLDDLEHQTIADKLEIIVVNSGSEQNEDAIVREYQQKYNNIVYIKTEHREGIYTAWNRAVKAARGRFITNTNTDDRHRKDALEIMASTLQANPDIALVYGDQIQTETLNDTFENHHGTQMNRRPEYSRARLLFGCCVGSQPMWRKSLHNEFGYFDDTLTCAADWDFWLRISNKYKLKHIPEFLGLYYYNEDGIEHGKKIHSLYERYIVGKRYGTPYISVIPIYQSKDNPLISVIMPAYNAAEYIAKAVESVLIQNYRNFELIVVDDGSTDDTRDIVAGFKDDKIKYFYKENAGPASTRNLAIKKSKGAFLINLDTDDTIMPDFISRHLMEFEEHPEADLIYCDDCLIGEDDKPIRVIERPEYRYRESLIRDLFRCGFPVVPFRTCIRRSVFDKIGFYDDGLSVGEDYDMIRRFVKHGLKAHHLKAPLYLRRIVPDSVSRKVSDEKAKAHFEVLRRFTESFSFDELFPDVAWDKIAPESRQLHAKCLAAMTYLAVGQTYVKTNSPFYAKRAFGQACSELRDSLKMDPGNQRIRQLLRKCRSTQAKFVEELHQGAC